MTRSVTQHARVAMTAALMLLPGCERKPLLFYCADAYVPCPETSAVAVERARTFVRERLPYSHRPRLLSAVVAQCAGGRTVLHRGDGFSTTTEYFDEKGHLVGVETTSDDGPSSESYGKPFDCSDCFSINLVAEALNDSDGGFGQDLRWPACPRPLNRTR